MEFPISPLVFTKLRVPAGRGRLIPRTHLVDLLNAKNDASFILVCAPAGYGKTTLLVQWTQSLLKKGTAVIWYSLDPEDDDPIPFQSYLISSFIQALGPIPELAELAQLLRTAPEMDLHYVLSVAINAILSSEQDCVLILDDYHLISAPAIHNALAFLLEHLPENLRIAIGSRSDPALPLARLRARGQMFEIRISDLRFKVDETAQFLNELMDLELSPGGIASLEERTEGWVTGLQLAALSLSGREDKEQVIASFTGSHRYLVEYLMEEVVARQSDEIQAFLLSTSILERLYAPLCDHLLKEKRSESHDLASIAPSANFSLGSQAFLETLEKSNLFLVPLDEEQTWFRYHHLFRDFLMARLERNQSERIPALHRSACEWLADNGLLREAAVHAFQTHDWEFAAAFAEQHIFTLITLSDISTIYEWCSIFPEEVMLKHPLLCLQQGLSLAYRFQRKNKPRVEARLQQVDQLITTLENRQLVRGLNDLAGVVRTFLAFAPDPSADPQELLVIAHSILNAYLEDDPGRFSGFLLTGYAHMALQDVPAAELAFKTARQISLREHYYFGVVESTFCLADLAQSQGQLSRAAEICRQGKLDLAAVLSHPEQELPAMGSLDITLGSVLMEQNQLEEADRCLHHGLELMGGAMNPHYLMIAYVALFRLRQVQNRPVEAMKALDHLEAIWPDISFLIEGLRVMQLLRTSPGEPRTLAKAESWTQSLATTFADETPLPGLGPFGAADVYYLARSAWVQAQIALGKAKSSRHYLEQQLDLATKHGLTQRVIELSLLDALASHSEGDHKPAFVALEHALQLAQPEGYLRIFDLIPALTPLLEQFAQMGKFQEYIGQIVTATCAPGNHFPVSSSPALYGEHLSEREMEVLRLLAQGATNQEIADHLVITVGTVKSHMNHILAKLDSHNRLEAVARARGLGLIQI